jgi:hypothetical protein
VTTEKDGRVLFKIDPGTSGRIDYNPFNTQEDFDAMAYLAIKTGEYEQHMNTFTPGSGYFRMLLSVVFYLDPLF